MKTLERTLHVSDLVKYMPYPQQNTSDIFDKFGLGIVLESHRFLKEHYCIYWFGINMNMMMHISQLQKLS